MEITSKRMLVSMRPSYDEPHSAFAMMCPGRQCGWLWSHGAPGDVPVSTTDRPTDPFRYGEIAWGRWSVAPSDSPSCLLKHPLPARIQNFLKGGGGGEAPPPLDIVRVTSSALQKIEKHTHSWTFTSTPPWTLPV